MVKQILSAAAQQARNLARQTSEEILKEPGKIAQEATRSTGLSPEPPQSSQPPQSSSSGEEVAAQLASTRAKIKSFAQKRSQEWQKTEVQAQQSQQKRVQQIVEARLGHKPAGPSTGEAGQPGQPEGPKEKEEKKGVLGALAGFFKGKKSRKLGVMGLGQAKKQASGEFGKSQQ